MSNDTKPDTPRVSQEQSKASEETTRKPDPANEEKPDTDSLPDGSGTDLDDENEPEEDRFDAG